MKKCKTCARDLAADQYERAEADECKECVAKAAKPDPTSDALSRLATAVEGMTKAQADSQTDTERRINEALAKARRWAEEALKIDVDALLSRKARP